MKWNFLYQITAASRTPDQGSTAPQIPVLSVLNWICWTTPRKKFLGTPLYECNMSGRTDMRKTEESQIEVYLWHCRHQLHSNDEVEMGVHKVLWM